MARPRVLSREKIASAALRLIDEEGLDALSLERIASELNVRGPSLYHHFPDKAAILTQVAELVLSDLEMDRQIGDWTDWLVEVSMTFYRRVMQHPRAAPVLIQFMPDSSALSGLGRAAQRLSRDGVDPSLQVLLMEGCEKIAWGWSFQRAAALQQGERLSPGRIGTRWPELRRAVRQSRWRDEQLLEMALRSFIRGVLDGAPDARRVS